LEQRLQLTPCIRCVAGEIVKAFAALEHAAEAQKNGSVPFSFFALDVQEKLAKFDETGMDKVSWA
jgi:hypothetical protein